MFALVVTPAYADYGSILLRVNGTEALSDTNVRTSQPAEDNGFLAYTYCGGNDASDENRCYFKYNIQNLTALGVTPSNIISATFRMTFNNNGSGQMNLSVYDVYLDNWSEATTRPDNQPCGNSVGSLNSAYCNGSAYDIVQVGNGGSDIIFNLTNYFKVKLANTSLLNVSFVIRRPENDSSAFNYRFFSSKDGGNAIGITPVLNVTYNVTTGGGGGSDDFYTSALKSSGSAGAFTIQSTINGSLTTNFVYTNSTTNASISYIFIYPSQTASVSAQTPGTTWGTRSYTEANGNQLYTYLRFDDFSLVGKQTILGAELDIYSDGAGSSLQGATTCGYTLYGLRQTLPWTEGTLTYNYLPISNAIGWSDVLLYSTNNKSTNFYTPTCTTLQSGGLWYVGGFNGSVSGFMSSDMKDFIINGAKNNLLDLVIGSRAGGTLGGTASFVSRTSTKTSFRPRLILTVVNNVTSDWTITRVGVPDQVAVDSIGDTYVSVRYTGSGTATARIGFSIGRGDTGFCDSSCYVNGTSYTDTDGSKWYGTATWTSGQTITFITPFKFVAGVFSPGQTYDIITTVRPTTSLTLLDKVINKNVLTTTTAGTPQINGTSGIPLKVVINLEDEYTNQTKPGIFCSIKSYTTGSVSYVQAELTTSKQQVCNFNTFSLPQIVNLTVTGYGFVTQNLTEKLFSVPSTVTINLLKNSTVNNCVVAGSSVDTTVCTQFNSINTVGASGYYCKYDPNKCIGTSCSTWGAWVMYVCFNDYLPGGVTNGSYYDGSFNLVTPGTSGTPGANQPGGSTNALDTSAQQVGIALGLGSTESKALISMFFTILITGIVVVKSKSKELGILTFIGVLVTFTLIKMFPAWLFILMIIISGLAIASVLKKTLTGG